MMASVRAEEKKVEVSPKCTVFQGWVLGCWVARLNDGRVRLGALLVAFLGTNSGRWW
jgi:uncharacterized protein YdiU (UPF0061 family)